MRDTTAFGARALSVLLGTAAAVTASAQTPSPGPTPTVTPAPPHVYVSDPTIVNTETTNAQRRAAVAVGEDDRYLIVWNSDAAQAGFHDIKAQLYSPEGVKIGGEFQVDQAPAGRAEYTPSVAAGGDGNYVVVWADFDGNPSTDSEIQMRRFDADGNALGSAIQVNSYTTGKQRLPRVAADSSGNSVIVWTSQDQDGSGLGVYARPYGPSGTPTGNEFLVNTTTTGDQDRPAVDMDDTGFTITFMDGSGGIAAREFSPFNAPAGTPQFPVLPGPDRRLPAVRRLDGTSNTIFFAENTASTGIDAVRTVDGAPQTPFVAASHGYGPRVARRRVGSFWWGHDDALNSKLQEYEIAPSGAVREAHPAFVVIPGGQIPDVASGPAGGVVVAAQHNDEIEAAAAGVPKAIQLVLFDDNGNGVLDPGESANLSATIGNSWPFDADLEGLLSQPFSLRDAPEALAIVDDTANYGTLGSGATGDCQATGDCYRVTAGASRPGPHWDEAVVETLTIGFHKPWTVHVGGSFADVSDTSLFYPFVENLFHNGVTAGGPCGGYCPTDGVKRQQMAVFLLKSRFGASFTPPPATGAIFADVPLSNPFAAWIEALYLLNVTGGCSTNPLQYCPDAIVNRQQMAVFLLKTKEGSTYDPPDCAGLFQDVPCTPGTGFSDWIEELYNRQITGGCVANPLQYCPTSPTNRQQMAAFLVKNFGLLLYGP